MANPESLDLIDENLKTYRVMKMYGDDGSGNVVAMVMDGDAIKVSIQSQTFPAQWVVEWAGTASILIATPVYTSGDVSMYNNHTFEAVTNTAKVEAQATSSGGWSSVQVLVDGSMSATIAAGKIGVLEGKFYAVRMKPNADAASTNGFGSHSVK